LVSVYKIPPLNYKINLAFGIVANIYYVYLSHTPNTCMLMYTLLKEVIHQLQFVV